ncbi:DUF4942 domain-containing protein [Methylobacterium sp.]|uniref:DUF4942 domain-containing protein n=1 Tax=Methylobacterium sp. TaxID=409 RepID=UPI003C71F5DB
MYDQTDTPEGSTALVSGNHIARISEAREAALAAYGAGLDQLAVGFEAMREAAKVAGIADGGHRFYSGSHERRSERAALDAAFGQDFDGDACRRLLKRDLDRAIWTRLLHDFQIAGMMDTQAREEFDAGLRGEDVPEATPDNIRATFERLCAEAETIFLRGLARTFAELDRRFKSHDGFKVGARIIIPYLMSSDTGHWNYCGDREKTLIEVERIFALLAGDRPSPGALRRAIEADRPGWRPRQSETVTRYFKVRIFLNGNGHLWIDPSITKLVNWKLAEFYGEVLGDAAPAEAEPDIFETRATVPARDLAFYATPAEVAEDALRDVRLAAGARVLEPSAGIGNLVWPLLRRGCKVDAVEIHPGRAATLEGRGHPDLSVRCANFLRLTPREDYDAIVMNPPFAGTHWMDHVMHAFAFLKPGGQLVAILPTSAEVNETPRHVRFRDWIRKVNRERWGRVFRDLPPESFRSVGVRINTVVLSIRK